MLLRERREAVLMDVIVLIFQKLFINLIVVMKCTEALNYSFQLFSPAVHDCIHHNDVARGTLQLSLGLHCSQTPSIPYHSQSVVGLSERYLKCAVHSLTLPGERVNLISKTRQLAMLTTAALSNARSK